MRFVDVDEKIIQDLKRSGLLDNMKSLKYCKFLAIEEKDGKIIGAAGVGGFFNIQSVVAMDQYKGKGIGKKLMVSLIKEYKKRGYSYSLGSRNPENTPIVKLGNLTGRYPLFRVNYAPHIKRDVNIAVFGTRGKIVAKFLSCFNTYVGMIFLAISIKILRRFFRTFVTYDREEFPEPSVKYMITHFEKIPKNCKAQSCKK